MLVAGAVVVIGLLANKTLAGWTALFLATAVATSATGFGFAFDHLLPSHILGILSLVVLLVAILARYVFHYVGVWRWIYALGIVLAVYFDAFVAVVQAFGKISRLNALAPTQSEPPFQVTQVVMLAVFAALAIWAMVKFRPDGKVRLA